MRVALAVPLLLLMHTAQPAPLPAKVEFKTDIQPILEKRCQPCHFEGGQMHAKLPFDQPKTIVTLGEKLFTRIRDERERDLIRVFLASTDRSDSASEDTESSRADAGRP